MLWSFIRLSLLFCKASWFWEIIFIWVLRLEVSTTTNNCLCGSTSQVPFVLLSVKRSIIENYPTSVWEGWIERARSFVQNEWIVKQAREECDESCTVAQKILLWKSCSTTHLIFLQNNFCGNAAYSHPNKLKKQEEKKQTKGGENEKLIILPLVPFQTLEAVI